MRPCILLQHIFSRRLVPYPPLGGLSARHCRFSKFDKLKPPRVQRSIRVNLKYGTRHKDGQRAETWKEGPTIRLKDLEPTNNKTSSKNDKNNTNDHLEQQLVYHT